MLWMCHAGLPIGVGGPRIQLEPHPDPKYNPCPDGKVSEKDGEHHQHIDPCIGKQQEIAALGPRNRTGRTDHRIVRPKVHKILRPRRFRPTDKEEQQKCAMP